MKKIFRKAMTVLGSAALIGMTVGAAAAASYPSPFTTSTAIVVGANAAPSDNIAAASIASNLDAASAGAVSGGTVTSVEGDVISLDTSSTRIWLNTSLDAAKSTLTKTDLPVVLGDYTFSGNVDAKLTSTITVGTGAATGGVGSNRVIFAKQPKTNVDPVIGISLGASTQALYNATFTSKAIALNSTDSEGENIRLFGRDFVISTSTDTDSIVLFSSAEEVNLVAGGPSPSPTASIVIDGTSYEVELITGTSTEATIAINGESKEVSEGASKKINGIEVAVKSVTESTALNTITASILVGSEKITFENGASVMKGADDDPIDGTTAFITGGPGALTKLVIQVYRATTSEDAILAGESFTDPVFGSFKVDFAGLNIPLDSSDRESIVVENSGDNTMSLTMTDNNAYTETFDFVHNASAQTFLGDDSNYTIAVMEMTNLTENKYIVLGNEEYGHLLQVTQIYNNTGTDYTNDKVKLQDVFSDEIYTATFTSEGTGSVPIDGKTYVVTFVGSGDDGSVQIKYPTSDSANANTYVTYPTIKTANGNQVAFYEPLTIDMGDHNGDGTEAATITLKFPDGDGYTSFTATGAGNATQCNWTIDSSVLQTGVFVDSAAGAVQADQTLTVGQLSYSMNATTTINQTKLYLNNPETGVQIVGPALIIFEGKDDNSEYHAIVVPIEANSAGTSSSGIGVDDVLFSSHTHYDDGLQSDSDVTHDVDWYGTLAISDANDADQKILTLKMPKTQVYAQVYLGETSAVVSGGVVSAGVMTVMDNAVSSVAGKNLIVVGGSAINSVAAELLGSAYRGEAFTSATDVGAGEFLIQSFARSGKTALLVAGYNAADTEKAVTYLLNNNVDTTVGVKMKGTSATEASLVTA